MIMQYEVVFQGMGCLPGDYHIEVDPTVPPVQHLPRQVPLPLKDKLKEKIVEGSNQAGQRTNALDR